ncbi:hypothetical protein [Methylocystis iwaonis]|uniref:hypothetical protein n=1 Tax=Methylocystis iwaonis TaxID=2885079 RepID=UPI002E7ACAE3|nr:hypothetical protein [Methylocystis iwaonis]
MVEFAHILGEVERLSEGAAELASHDEAYLRLLEIERFDCARTREPPAGARSRRANELYAASESDGSARDDKPAVTRGKFELTPSELRRLILQLNNPALSLLELHALRRELAWRFHPDRLTLADRPKADDAMAQLNARIDALIQEKKSSGPPK